MPTPTPFRIDIPQATLDDMRARLRNTRWSDDFGNADWTYGVESSWLKSMVRYWAEDFDWRKQEAEMNRLPHFRTEIDGMPIHFIHVRGKGKNPVPLILSHGWPWTFWDWNFVIGPLTDPEAYGGNADDSFDVIIPSLPGFGFSEPLRTTGISVRQIAPLWVKLMAQLGHETFAAAGGDWGAFITMELGHAHPQHLRAVHMTLPCLPGIMPQNLTAEDFAPDEQWMAKRAADIFPAITSHTAVHGTDPQTLAYALADSPVGTAAWIWERRRAWSDCDGDVETVFSRDFLCTTASIYWLTNTIGSSLRIYKERALHPFPPLPDRAPTIPVPTGFAIHPKELRWVPKRLAEQHSNLTRWTIMPKGGHFAPSEQPAGIIHEYREFFRAIR